RAAFQALSAKKSEGVTGTASLKRRRPDRAREMFDVSKMNMDLTVFRPGSLTSYLVAIALVVVAAFVRVERNTAITGLPFMSLFPAVVVATVLCGAAAGTIAMILSAILAWAFILPPGMT